MRTNERMLRRKQRILEDLKKMKVGLGATKHVGSDAYPFYVATVKMLTNGRVVVGMYEADSHFEKSWTEGVMVTDKFDKNKLPEFWLTIWRNAWYKCDQNGILLVPHQQAWYTFGYASSYQDPSF